MNILLVEDNPADARLLREALTELEVPVQMHWMSSGEAALRFLRRGEGHTQAPWVDLVLLDLNLPGLSGLEVLADIKHDPDLMCTPVIALTSSCSPADVSAAYRAHVNAYMRKPDDFDECLTLAAALHRCWLSLVVRPPRQE